MMKTEGSGRMNSEIVDRRVNICLVETSITTTENKYGESKLSLQHSCKGNAQKDLSTP
jgi:hypothetical protein